MKVPLPHSIWKGPKARYPGDFFENPDVRGREGPDLFRLGINREPVISCGKAPSLRIHRGHDVKQCSQEHIQAKRGSVTAYKHPHDPGTEPEGAPEFRNSFRSTVALAPAFRRSNIRNQGD